jgi:hypothetical protein
MTFTLDIPESRERAVADGAAQPAAETAPNIGAYDEQDRSGLAELAEFYRKLGFEAGYSKAARDQLEYSVLVAEQVLREHQLGGGLTDPRRLLYAFIARVDRRLSLFANSTTTANDEGYMEGGLGI